MKTVHSLYFDGAIVQVLKVCISGDTVTIDDAQTFAHFELDGYLSGCVGKTFVISCNPLQFNQDILHLPPAASRQYNRLVRFEVQKLHPELTSFTTFHSNVGQVTIDTKVYNKIAAFSYADEIQANFISAFNRRGKVISHSYAAPYAIFRLIASTCLEDTAEARIFIASIPGEKFLLAGEFNELEFIRKIPSSDAILLPADIQNINMTLDYCFQTIRVKPVEAVMLKQSEIMEEEFPLLSVPMRASQSPLLEGVPHHILADYLAPLAAALHYFKSPHAADILPTDYVSFSRSKKVLSAAGMFMIVFAILLAGFALMQWMVISDLKSGIGTLRSNMSRSNVELANFRKLDEKLKSLSKPLEIIKNNISPLNPAEALASLTLPNTEEYYVKGISIQNGAGFLSVQMEGDITVSGLGNIQATFEWIVEKLGKIPGYAVSSSTLDIKQKTFKIQARYNGVGKQGK